jgi:hypothetical protein
MRHLFSLFHTVCHKKKLASLLLSLKRKKGASFFLNGFSRSLAFLGLLISLWLAPVTKGRKLEGELVSPLSNQTLVSDIMKR